MLNPATGPKRVRRVQHRAPRGVVVAGELGEGQHDRKEQHADDEKQPGAEQAGVHSNLAGQGKYARADHRVQDEEGCAKKADVTPEVCSRGCPGSMLGIARY